MSPKGNDLATRRMVLIRYGVCGLLGLAVISQARVHLVQRNQIMERARDSKRFIVERPEPAIRGAIYSADGKALSQADDKRLLVVDFRKVPHSSGFFMALGAASGISPSELAAMSKSGKNVVEWNRMFSPTQSEAIQDVKRKWRADGIGTRVSPNRAYGLGEAASSLVGVYRANGARLGVEQAFDETLKGANGKIVGMVDKEGQYLPMRVDRSTKRKTDGKPVTLTIDSELQHAAYEAIKSAVTARNARQGAVVMMDPMTGNVLACASYPSFDPTKPFRETKAGELPDGFATAFQASLEPGSTFKIATVAKAIDDGVLTSKDVVKCTGQFTVGKRTLHCALHGGTRSHGTVNPEQAIARSCNVAAAQWALKVGTEKFNAFLEDVGLLNRDPLGLPGEPRPQYLKDAPAPKLHLANVGFGQSINVTPVALASAFCAIANGGVAVKPRLIDRVGEEIQPIHRGKRVLQPETCKTVLDYMRSVMESDRGTGKSLRIPGYDLGGKTGTAQKTNRSTKSMQGGGYVANFVGFVPVSSPRAVILVMVDDPKGEQYYGAQVAGPVFLEVAKHAIKRLSIPKGVLPTKFASAPLDGPRNAAPTLSVKSRPVGERQRPLVIGRKDQAVAQTEGVVVDRKARNLVSQRDGNEKKDPRIKLREENEAATRRATTPDKPKSKSKIVSRPADKELRGVSTSGQSAIGIRREPQADARASSKRASVKKPAETPKVSTAKATSKRSSKPDEPSKTSTRPVTSQRTSEPTEPEKKSSGPRISMRKSQEPSEPKAGTSKRTSDAKKSVGTTKKATTSVKATGTKTVSKSTTRTTKAEDRVRELERENERLRKLLDKDSAGLATKRDGGTGSRSAPKKTLVGGNKGKAAATTAKTSGKTSSKTGATTRKKSDSKKPSTKPE